MRFEETAIAGCFEIVPQILRDARGCFVKTFHEDQFRAQGLRTDFAEEYYSVSHKGVLRGMHFQKPPADHAKLVYCTRGTVLDVIVDLRKASKTYGRWASFELNAEKANSLYLPSGIAHGFTALSDDALMVYKVTSVYQPEHDAGIRWDSFGAAWPDADFIISDRDRALPALADFANPF